MRATWVTLLCACSAIADAQPAPDPPRHIGTVELDHVVVTGPGISADIIFGMRREMAERCFGAEPAAGKLEVDFDRNGKVLDIQSGFSPGASCVAGIIRRYGPYQPYKQPYKVTMMLEYTP